MGKYSFTVASNIIAENKEKCLQGKNAHVKFVKGKPILDFNLINIDWETSRYPTEKILYERNIIDERSGKQVMICIAEDYKLYLMSSKNK